MNEVMRKHGIPEQLNPVMRESIRIYTTTGILISKQPYQRCLVGDHGAYIEMNKGDICLQNFIMEDRTWSQQRYYERWWAKEGQGTTPGTMLYEQLKTVQGQQKPPGGGQQPFAPWRTEGYADYKIGMFYVSVDMLKIEFE
jgi:hypothetical protein